MTEHAPPQMPAEFAPHSRCWMTWPHKKDLWRDRLTEAELAYARVAVAISRFEPVSMLALPGHEGHVVRMLAELGGTDAITVHAMDTDDSWLRDSGPTFIKRGDALWAVSWRFNSYGNKYPHDQCRQTADRVAEIAGVPVLRSALTIEGGAIHTDGEGTLITTDAVALNHSRNPGWTREMVEAEFARVLGIEKVIWLPRGLMDDDTDGHVDELACFVKPGVVLAAVTEDRDDPDYPVLQDNLARLKAATDAKGRGLEVIPIHQPEPHTHWGWRIAASYINHYVANGGVVAPAFGDKTHDAAALELFGRVYPGRQIVQVDSRTVSFGGGNIHCITQQQPA